MTVRRRLSCLSTLLHLFLCIQSLYSQESPTLQLEPFNFSVSYRQSVCERQAQLDNGTLQLRHALEGLQVSTYVPADNRYVNFNQTINASNPGIIAVLLDEIASRGRFTWRNSFGVLNSLVLPDNKTFNELLDWSVWAYDVSAGQWLKSVTRMERGVTFPSGWYDGRVIMVGVQPEGSAGLDLWSFLQPFSAGVWVMIGVTVVISGIVYWFLDWFDTDSDSLELDKRPGQSIFLSFLAFTGQFEFRPVSSSAQIFTASLSFWALIMMSAYTANLASFLVVQNTPSIKINTVGDAVLNNYVICVVRSATPDNALTVAWPEARVLRTQTELEMYERVRNGTCQVMLTTMSSWNEYEGDATVNGDCRLGWIGRVFLEGEGGFAVKSDSGTLCSSLVRDVFNLHMEEMKDDGFLQSTWDDFLKRHETVDCMGNVGAEEDNNSNQLSLNAMGGTFVLHYIMTAFATLLAFAWKCKKKYRPSTHKRWGISARNVTGDCENGVNTVEKSVSVDQASIDTGIRLESLADKQNEKLTELAKQNMDMLATINAMKSELSSVGAKEEGGGLKF